eukprot:TRINITY_DN15196_c0_g1_i1.p2 TRINITY_DN15196_c0_g1~~TRINITY_DN15196_c0_g1_i1.p2  ORF type:complete len:108 (-),score=15.87 TRINITY_DN15196_c0_g1_i1:285-608(-)
MMFDQQVKAIGKSDDVFTFDCLFLQYVNEWCIPIENCAEAVRQIRDLIENEGFKVHLPIEVRFVAPDDAWLSPTYKRLSCYIGVIMYRPYGYDVPHRQYFKEYTKNQ